MKSEIQIDGGGEASANKNISSSSSPVLLGGMHSNDIVRLLVQTLRDLGHVKSASLLEEESGVILEEPVVVDFKTSLYRGEWDRALSLLEALDVNSQDDLRNAKFLVNKQQYLEYLEQGNVASALGCLQTKISPLNCPSKQLNQLTCYILCRSPEELRETANWDGAKGNSRARLLSDLRGYISPSQLVPEKRLQALFVQALQAQQQKCLYHNTLAQPTDLYKDHRCSKSHLPRHTEFILEGHSDEVWYVRFSNDGTMLASASKDETVIIWSITEELVSQDDQSTDELVHNRPLGSETPFVLNPSSSLAAESKSMLLSSDDGNDEDEDEDDNDSDNDEDQEKDEDDEENVDDDDESEKDEEMRDAESNSSSSSINSNNVKSDISNGTSNSNSCSSSSSSQNSNGCTVNQVHNNNNQPLLYRRRFRFHRRLEGHKTPLSFLSWSPNNRYLLTCGNNNEVRLWRVRDGKCIKIFDQHSNEITAVGWLPDSKRFISAGQDRYIFMLNRSGQELRKWSSSRINDLVVTADGKWLVTACQEKKIGIYSLTDNSEPTFIQETENITSLALAADGCVAANLTTQEIHLWDLPQRRLVQKFFRWHEPGRYVIRSAFGGARDAFVISGSEDSQVYVWHRETGQLLEVLGGHAGTVNAVAWNPQVSGIFASASDDGTVRVWTSPFSTSSSSSSSSSCECSLKSETNQ